MANINDYILWRGDIPIDEKYKFNEIDSMILARFSYLIFDRIEMTEEETIGSISEKMKDFPNEDFLYNGDKEMITYLGHSERFQNMKVTDFVITNDKEAEKQFGAITIHYLDSEMYISYLGTDWTINGWKEDFNMAFMDKVPCQIAGKEYLEKVAFKYPNKKIRIGGHSKGGNVAIYSGITISEDIKQRIIKIYNYDGPGFNKEMINKYANDEIINKIETYIPQDSVVGRLLNHKEKTTISLSVEKGILQHDIFSWQVLKDEMLKSAKNTDNSEVIDKTLTDWLEITTADQRKIVIDSVFEILYSTDAISFGDITNNLPTSIPKILKKYGELSKDDKENITSMIKIIINSYRNVIKEKDGGKLDNLKTIYKHKLEQFDEKRKLKFEK